LCLGYLRSLWKAAVWAVSVPKELRLFPLLPALLTACNTGLYRNFTSASGRKFLGASRATPQSAKPAA
jgi:hypothetical protein